MVRFAHILVMLPFFLASMAPAQARLSVESDLVSCQWVAAEGSDTDKPVKKPAEEEEEEEPDCD